MDAKSELKALVAEILAKGQARIDAAIDTQDGLLMVAELEAMKEQLSELQLSLLGVMVVDLCVDVSVSAQPLADLPN